MNAMLSTVKNKLKEIIPFLVIILGLFGFIYALNIYYPIFVDDWVYSFKFLNGERLGSFFDVLESQYKHYFEWGGRSVGHTVAQTLLWFGEGWSDLLNSIAFVVFVLVIYAIANKNAGKSQPAVLVLICLLIWFIQRHYLSECLLWVTGSGNYLWGCFITLLFLRPVCSYYLKPEDKKNDIVRSIVLFIGGILAGWTNESMSVTLLFFIISLLLLTKYEKKAIPQWAIAGLAGAVIGCIILLAAPGNYIRYEQTAELEGLNVTSPVDFYLQRFLAVVAEFIKYGLIPSMLYIATLVLFLFLGEKENKTNVLRLSLLFFITSLVSVLVMAGAPIFPERTWLGILFFTISGITILYANLDFSSRKVRIFNHAFFVLALITFCFSYYRGAKETVRISHIFSEREHI